MKKFELDTIYKDGEFEVVARTDSKVVFIRYGTEFLTGEVFLKNGDECTEVYDKIIEADDNAISISAHESDIREWLDIAQENLEYIQHYGAESDDDESHLKNAIKALEKRLFDKQKEVA